MTGRQEAFARLVVSGKGPSEAYRQAGYRVSGMSHRSIAVEAAHLQGHHAVAARIAELRSEADQTAVLTMQRRREILREIAEDPEASGAERVTAIREDAVLAGERRTDGTQINVAGDVTITQVLAHLRGGAESGRERLAEFAEVDGPFAAISDTLPRDAPRSTARSPVPCGPLGRIRLPTDATRFRSDGTTSAVVWESEE